MTPKMFGQSPPSYAGSNEDATFFDDLSLGSRIRRTLSHSPGPLRLLDSHSPVRRSPSDGSYERPHYQYHHSSSTRSPLHQQLGFDQHHRHGPSSSSVENDNNNNALSQNTALAVGKLQEDLRKAMNSLNRMKQQKETADARARDAQQKNEQLLQEKRLLQQRMATGGNLKKNNNNLPSTGGSNARQFHEEQGDNATTNLESGENSNQLVRDFRAALEQVETLQAALDATTRNQHSNNTHQEQSNSRTKVPSISPGGPQSTGNKSPRDSSRIQQLQVEQVSLELEEAKQLLQSRDAEVLRLREELEQAKKESGEEIRRLGLALEEMRDLAGRLRAGAGVSPTIAAAAQDGPTESIVDRLSRIRDAADRASLVKDHHREIMRLKAQQDSQIKAISSQNEEKLQKVFNSTKLLLSTKHKEALESLQSEYDKSMAAMEQRHRDEIERLRKEIIEGSHLSEELLAAAMSKIGSGKQLITREMGNSHQMKEAIRQLEQRTLYEKANEKAAHVEEVQALKRSWEQQREAMLDTMKAQVNDLFSKNRISTQGDNDKPTGTPDRLDTRSQVQEILERSFDIDPDQKVSSPYTGMDDELRETEALVRGLLRDL